MSVNGSTVDLIRENCGKVNRKHKIVVGPKAIGKELKLRRPQFEKIYGEAVRSFGEVSHEAAVARYFLATSLARTEEFEKAEYLFRTNLSVYEKLSMQGTDDYVWSLNKLIDLGMDSENHHLVAEVFEEYSAGTKRWPSASFKAKYFFWFRYYEFLMLQDQLDKAIDAYSRVYEGAAEVWGFGHEQHFIAVAVYADLLLVANQKQRARAIALEALEIGRTNSTVPRDWVTELESQLGV